MKRTIHSKYLFHGVELPSTYVPPIIVAYNIRTPENVGSIIRLADNIVCDKVLFVSDSNDIRESKIKKTAASSFKSVNWKFCTQAELDNKIPDDYNLVAIETTSDSENIYQAKLQSKVAFVVGNEVAGVDDTFLDRCSKIVHIPIYGKNTSLNVSHALALALFEWQRQMVL